MPGTYRYPGKSNNIHSSLIHFINISDLSQNLEVPRPPSPHPGQETISSYLDHCSCRQPLLMTLPLDFNPSPCSRQPE